jgi:hypothetical protein
VLNEEDRLVVIRFGRDADSECMAQDEVLYRIADRVKNFAVIVSLIVNAPIERLTESLMREIVSVRY